MTNSSVPHPATRQSPTEIETKNETAYALAADLLERALQGPVDSLHIVLLQITDSGLIAKEDIFRPHFEKLCRDGENLTGRLFKFYPACSHGGANRLLRKCHTLAEQVDLYRQEQFWRMPDSTTLMQSEALIGDVFKFYNEVNFLLRSIDQEQPDYRIEDRRKAPQRTPNPYQSIDHD